MVDYSLFYISDLFNTGQANADFDLEESDLEDESVTSRDDATVKSSMIAESELVSLDIDSDDD
jgi:hypothetical protein